MDALVLVSSGITGSVIPAGLREWLRRRIAWLPEQLSGGGSAPGAGPGAVVGWRNPLVAYTGATIVLGLGMLAMSTLLVELWPAIDPGLPGTTLAGPTGGLLLWLLFGLLGSLKVMRTPDGGYMTFHMPFIGAAMILGGPTAGALVAFLSTIERRELESQPWYGILANHAALTIAAVIGGLVTGLVRAQLGGPDQAQGGWGAGTFAAAAAGMVVLAAVSTAMGAATVILRDGGDRHAFGEALLGMVGRVSAIEIALGIVLALAWAEIGWWSPVLIGGFVLLLWDNHPLPPLEAPWWLLTGVGLERTLEAALGRMRRGITQGASVLLVEIDNLERVYQLYGPGACDTVAREIGSRLRTRASKPGGIAGHLDGARLVLFLAGPGNLEAAREHAGVILADICKPIATDAGPVSVEAAAGGLRLHSGGGTPSLAATLRRLDQALSRARRTDDHVWFEGQDETSAD